MSVAAEQFEEKIKSLDERMKYWEEDRQALSARRERAVSITCVACFG
eukprot:COSAG01_NODE_3155_length_6492_cov_3.966995_8_plen_47_part_00